MNPATLAIFLFVVGLILMISELTIPTHGVLAILGGLGLTASVVVSFTISRWVGAGALTAVALLGPIMTLWLLYVWPKTPVGKRIVLQPVEDSKPAPAVAVGMMGIAVSELRPMGMCEFGDVRVEARSEHGLIPAGKTVKVVALVDDRPSVRAI